QPERMPAVPSWTSLALLLGLSFFFGLAFEEFYRKSGEERPGGIRTFPVLSIGGGVLYLLDTQRLLPFTAGLLVLGAWLFAFYRERIRVRDEKDEPNAGLMVPLCNVQAYLLGAVALAFPAWMAVGVTVASVLFFTGRERLHDLARKVEISEIVTAGQFLILTGLVLPLLPDQPVTTLTHITPRQAWLALLAVCSVSYASYLVQRVLAPTAGDIWMALLGGLYSSTATTVVLARRAKSDPGLVPQARAGITLATSVMYLRVLIVVSVLNLGLAIKLAPALVALGIAGLITGTIQYRAATQPRKTPENRAPTEQRNPLELGTAVIFAALFLIITLVSSWVGAEFGISGIFVLAALVGVADVDPFVLNLAQGGVADLSASVAAAAILISTASNNLLKASYAASFAGFRIAFPAVASLTTLSVLTVIAAVLVGRG
ncbi:MAG: MgtC/SapB family protein, partial [Stellaceae bacterium]